MYLLDSDAAKCLCQYLLIEDLAIALGIDLTNFAVLPQLRFQLHLANDSKALKKLGSAEAVTSARKLIESANEVVVLVQSANYLLLANRPDIDEGELALFAALCDDASRRLVTGDKRALIALSQIKDVLSFTWYQIMCLEEAIAILTCHYGHDHVSARVRRRPDVNLALSIAFGRTMANDAAGTKNGLRSYLGALNGDTGGKYIPVHLNAKEAAC